jgi:hypothetical protein
MAVTESDAVPPLATVSTTGAEERPTVTLPKDAEAGATVSLGLPTGGAGLSLGSPGKVRALISTRFDEPSPSESAGSMAVKLCPAPA